MFDIVFYMEPKYIGDVNMANIFMETYRGNTRFKN